MIYLQLFLTFVQIGFLSIGGGYVVLPLIQNTIVARYHWITPKEFADLITIAEATPGPLAINSATFVGLRTGGILGGVLATFGCILPSLFIVSVISFVYHKYKDLSAMQSVLGVLKAVVVVLIAIACIKIMILMLFNGGSITMKNFDFISFILFSLALLGLRLKKMNPILVIFICGALRLGLSFVL